MTRMLDHDQSCTQAVFAEVIGVNQSTVSRMLEAQVIAEHGTLGEWIKDYSRHIREQAAGRLGSDVGGLDLVQERAALAREQRIGQAIKNGVARKEYGPVGLLADVLGTASSAVVDRFDHLEGMLAKSCPDLPEEAKTAVFTVIADARNEWIRSTAKLVDAAVDEMLAADEDEAVDVVVDPFADEPL